MKKILVVILILALAGVGYWIYSTQFENRTHLDVAKYQIDPKKEFSYAIENPSMPGGAFIRTEPTTDPNSIFPNKGSVSFEIAQYYIDCSDYSYDYRKEGSTLKIILQSNDQNCNGRKGNISYGVKGLINNLEPGKYGIVMYVKYGDRPEEWTIGDNFTIK